MQEQGLPYCFDRRSIVLIESAEAFRLFLEGSRVQASEWSLDRDPDLPDDLELQQGPCLVALEQAVAFETRPHPRLARESVPAEDPQEYVLRLAASLWLADYRAGAVRHRDHQSLKDFLEVGRETLTEGVVAVPMRDLERRMCVDEDRAAAPRRGPSWINPRSDQSMVQYPGAYRTLYETGTLVGIMNRSRCHLDCGVDFVWIEDDLCHMWMRSDTVPNAEWIRLFPFRVDRSGPPGRLSASMRRGLL